MGVIGRRALEEAMKRREFIAVLSGAAAWPFVARAQEAGKIPRIGYLSPRPKLSPVDRSFMQGLGELGYIDDKNILIEFRFAAGNFKRLPAMAAELVRLNVDVIVTVVTQASLAAKGATKTIPVVMLAVSDPIAAGLIKSLARPGGNVTGTSSQTAEVQGKSLQLLKQVVPKLRRVAVLWNPANAIFQTQMLQAAKEAAIALDLKLHEFGVRNPNELDHVFAAISNAHVGALMVLGDPTLIVHKAQIIKFAAKIRLPAIYATKDHAEAGGLITYGPDYAAQYRRGAFYVDKILKGVKPADLPVEQPTKFELAINLKTAKALGLQIPPALLIRADKVIE
jgi:putative ABC transport system substrate-binding protein